jgi:hypothetical protein
MGEALAFAGPGGMCHVQTVRFVCGRICASCFVPLTSSAATVAQILGSPSTYDGQHVDVRGTVERLEQEESHKGNPYVTFSLCSGSASMFSALGHHLSDG